MLFNSFEFLIFFPLVASIYFLIPHKYRWLHLLLASCIFYMAFIPVYILILFFTIVIDYFAGILIEKAQGKNKKLYLSWSIIANVAVLAVFKYYNFFIDNANDIITAINPAYRPMEYLGILLPVGLSFHTFQAMSYTIEVYRGNQKAEKHFGIYALYVMFFPQLVAGPIERPQNILHQFHEEKKMDYSNITSGLRLMAWGFFKKCVIADRLGILVGNVHGNLNDLSGFPVFLGMVFFAIQIYCDFSGYSDIAIGSARVMGYKLMRNFNYPFISKNVTEFWRRWHISLSTWFNDYLFMPLITKWRDAGIKGICFALMFTFFLSGLWHGAGWNFIIYGLLHGLALVVELLTKKSRKKLFSKLPSWVGNGITIIITFLYVSFSWIFFRSKDVNTSLVYIGKLFTGWKTSIHSIIYNENFSRLPNLYLGEEKKHFFIAVLGVLILFSIEHFHRTKNIFSVLYQKPSILRWSGYYLLILSIFFFGVYTKTQFIYFQF